MRDGKVAIMNTGFASGENRITKAIEDALNSPLLNTTDVNGAKKVLLSLYCSHENEIKMEEITQIHDFMAKVGEDVTVIWGASFDEKLGDEVKITLIATGFDVKDIPGMPANMIKHLRDEEKRENDELAQENLPFNEELEEQKKSAEAEINKAMGELYGSSIKQPIVPEKKEEEALQGAIEFDNFEEVEDIKLVDISDLDDEGNLQKVEEIPSWKRRFLKK